MKELQTKTQEALNTAVTLLQQRLTQITKIDYDSETVEVCSIVHTLSGLQNQILYWESGNV
jgi:hypothetical protein